MQTYLCCLEVTTNDIDDAKARYHTYDGIEAQRWAVASFLTLRQVRLIAAHLKRTIVHEVKCQCAEYRKLRHFDNYYGI